MCLPTKKKKFRSLYPVTRKDSGYLFFIQAVLIFFFPHTHLSSPPYGNEMNSTYNLNKMIFFFLVYFQLPFLSWRSGKKC